MDYKIHLHKDLQNIVESYIDVYLDEKDELWEDLRLLDDVFDVYDYWCNHENKPNPKHIAEMIYCIRAPPVLTRS